VEIKSFFTPASLLTIGGATVAVVAVSNTARKVFGVRSPKVAFFASVGVALYGSIVTGVLAQGFANGLLQAIGTVPLIVLNGCLLFTAAAGVNELSVGRPVGKAKKHAATRKVFFGSWFHDPDEESPSSGPRKGSPSPLKSSTATERGTGR
jgi:hypothetical protein